ncbi:larval cuticle protein 65Ag1 [Folsomia candida]|uniref:Endocuticle structural glycoprotein SgAbd-3 n=1 Tax=Folsomia candida TaxID=158441 RepID=A0A226E122_FOLCA|nr:larval cuticle protein 65Ag1 [Folsomia candida]OXA50621.1 Endocuticle structural glycoprotein SgAbd-3 [Folsomia candida]
MKFVALALVAIVGVAVARPQQEVTVTRSEFENDGEKFSWVSELSDGQKQEQSGFLKQIGEEKGISISGSYSYTSPEGELIELQYVADEHGFQPTGKHLPTSPPIPEAIQKALDIIYKNAESAGKKH